MGPDRAREMAAAMQMHLDERKAQVGTLANQGGALMEAAMMGAGEAYNGLSMPMRPYDAITAEGIPQGGPGPALEQEMLVARNPGLGMEAAPTMGMSPQELGIGPSPEWMAESDKQLSDLEFAKNQQAFQRAMRKAAMKVKKQQYSDEYGTPEAAAERSRLAADHWEKRNAS
jgi:hypothetical protein